MTLVIANRLQCHSVLRWLGGWLGGKISGVRCSYSRAQGAKENTMNPFILALHVGNFGDSCKFFRPKCGRNSFVLC